MVYSRLRRYSEQMQKVRLYKAVLGSIALIVFLAVFGVKILVGFSLLVDRIRGGSPATAGQQVILQPPILDPLSPATNSAELIVSGRGPEGFTLLLYINESETQTTPLVGDGSFIIGDLSLREGVNTISARVKDDKGNVSELSDVVTTTYRKTPPKLDVTDPGEGATITGDNSTIEVKGTTEDEVTITVNDRLAVIHSDNSFSYSFRLSEGENTLKVVATDAAGNQTTVERKVTYHR